MRKLLLSLLVIPLISSAQFKGALSTLGVGAPVSSSLPTLINTVCGPTVASTSGGTSSPVNMTGANFYALVIGQNNAAVTISDSSSDAFTQVPFTVGGIDLGAYAYNVVGGAAETFTVVGASSWAQFCVMGFSGMPTTNPFQGKNFNGPSFTTSLNTGPITPTATVNVLISGLNWIFQNGVTTLTINSGFSTPLFLNAVRNTGQGVGMSYLIQSGTATQNPTWGINTNVGMFTNIMSFNGH